jgi:chromosome segregation ATPase
MTTAVKPSKEMSEILRGLIFERDALLVTIAERDREIETQKRLLTETEVGWVGFKIKCDEKDSQLASLTERLGQKEKELGDATTANIEIHKAISSLRSRLAQYEAATQMLTGARSGQGWVIGNVELAARMAESALARKEPTP